MTSKLCVLRLSTLEPLLKASGQCKLSPRRPFKKQVRGKLQCRKTFEPVVLTPSWRPMQHRRHDMSFPLGALRGMCLPLQLLSGFQATPSISIMNNRRSLLRHIVHFTHLFSNSGVSITRFANSCSIAMVNCSKIGPAMTLLHFTIERSGPCYNLLSALLSFVASQW